MKKERGVWASTKRKHEIKQQTKLLTNSTNARKKNFQEKNSKHDTGGKAHNIVANRRLKLSDTSITVFKANHKNNPQLA